MIKCKDCTYCNGTGIYSVPIDADTWDTQLCPHCIPNCNTCADTKRVFYEFSQAWSPYETYQHSKPCPECNDNSDRLYMEYKDK